MSRESAFIDLLRRGSLHPGAQSLHDDCAILDFAGETLVLTHDMLAEGVHFLPGQDPVDVAWKLVATNMSDLAAKGAEPLGVLLGYQLGENDTGFAAGLNEALTAYEVPLLGGDTIAQTGTQVLGLTAIGRATYRPVPSRAGAKPGDALWITGAVGAAMLGYEAQCDGSGDSLAYRRPSALIGEGKVLAPHVTAMMDVSDGLLLDAARMARASKLSFAISRSSVPIATPEARRDEALRWGEDYQLLFTCPPQSTPPVAAFRIGKAVEAGEAPILLDGQPLCEADGLGYEHR